MRKSRFPNKRVAAQKWSTTTLVPRTLYPPLPAEMRMALRAVTVNTYSATAGNMNFQSVSCISPQQIGGDYPSAFGPFMQIYGRSVVDRVTVKFTIIPYMAGAAPIDVTTYGPLQLTACVIPWIDGQNLPLNDASFRRLAARPEAKSLTLAHPYAEESKTFVFSVDVRKALANFREEHYCIKSDRDGNLILPAQNNIQESPMIAMGVLNQFGTDRYYYVRRDVVYHMTFSMAHTTSLVVPLA